MRPWLVRRLAVCGAAALAVASPAASACAPLLALLQGEQVVASLGSCDVDLVAPTPGVAGLPVLSLRLRPSALQAWAQVLQAQGQALLGAQLQVGPYEFMSVPRAVLLPSPSARLVEAAHWRWDASNRLSLYLPPAEPSDCVEPRLQARSTTPLVMWFGVREVVPGEVVLPRVFLTQHPGERAVVPETCLGLWSVAGQPPAQQVSARLGAFQVPAEAREGDTYTLGVRAGERQARGRVRVLGPVQAALVGPWVQVAEYGCEAPTQARPPSDPIRELVFSGDGRFSMTWQPFESRVDVTGTWRVDTERDASAVTLEVQRDDFHGTAPRALGRLTAPGELDLPGWRVGTSARQGDVPRGPCGARFRRVGA